MSSQPLRWGILGTANIARKNWQAIHHSGNSVLTAVASRTLARAEQFVGECQAEVPLPSAPRALGSYEELLALPEVDAVYLPLPTGQRKDWVIRAAEAGKHVLCEKPCAISYADLQAMTEACRKSGVQFMDGVMYVHGLRFRYWKKLIQDGVELGEVRRVCSQFSFRGDDDFFANNMRSHSDLEPQGCVGDLGWYSLVLTLEVLGGRMPREVTGRLLSEFHRPGSPRPIPTEFTGELFYEGGVTAAYYSSFITENQQWANVSGTKGHLHLSDFVLPFEGPETAFLLYQSEFVVQGCHFAMRPGMRRIPIAEASNNHPTAQETLMFHDFANQVASGSLNDEWPRRALATQRLLDACLESAAAGGRPVAIA